MLSVIVASILFASSLAIPSKSPNMNGAYVISPSGGADPNATKSLFPTNFKDYPNGVEFFEIYSPTISTLYSQEDTFICLDQAVFHYTSFHHCPYSNPIPYLLSPFLLFPLLSLYPSLSMFTRLRLSAVTSLAFVNPWIHVGVLGWT
jgi:hypothetical protein